MKTWNFGIIGAGLIADFHATAINNIKNARLVAVTGTNQQKAAKLAQKYQCKLYSHWSDMLESKEIDIVTIATPSGAHMEPAVAAAQKGKHVLCEKPIEVTAERVDNMIKAHADAGTYLGGIFNFRFDPTTDIIKKAVDSGRLGTITYAAVYVPWWRSNDYYTGWHGTRALDGGGALMNQSIHMIDLLQYIMGPVESVGAFTSNAGHPQIETEDAGVAILRFKNKTLGTIYGTTSSWPGQNRRMEITGTKGTIVLLEDSLQTWQFEQMTAEDDEIIKIYGKLENASGVADPAAISFHYHLKNTAAFIEAIEQNKPFKIDGNEARKAVDIILKIYESAETGKIIKIAT